MPIDPSITFKDAYETDWRVRAIVLSQGRQTPMGAVLLALLRSKRGRPAWGTAATITPEGKLISPRIDKDGVIKSEVVSTVDQYQSFLSGIARDADLTEEEAQALFKLGREWITADLRPGGTDLHFWYEAKKKGMLQ